MPAKPPPSMLGHDHSGCPACSGDVYGFVESIRKDERERLGVHSKAEVKRLRRHARFGAAVDELVNHYKRQGVGFRFGGSTTGPVVRIGEPSYTRDLRHVEETADAALYWEERHQSKGDTGEIGG